MALYIVRLGDALKADETHTEKDILGFLQVLDCRRYEVGLIPNNPESYKATSRQKISN